MFYLLVLRLGFDALQCSEHEDYSITQSSNPEFTKTSGIEENQERQALLVANAGNTVILLKPFINWPI